MCPANQMKKPKQSRRPARTPFSLPLTPEEAAQRRSESRRQKYRATRAKKDTTKPDATTYKAIEANNRAHILQSNTLKKREAKWVRILADMWMQVKDLTDERELEPVREMLWVLAGCGLTPAQLADLLNIRPKAVTNIPAHVLSRLPNPIAASGHHWTLWVRKEDRRGYKTARTWEWEGKWTRAIRRLEREEAYLQAQVANGREDLSAQLRAVQEKLKQIRALTPEQGVPKV
jgi:hypothetical protein